jgi:hypothetical protein
MVTVFEVGDPTVSKSRAPAGIAIRAVPMRSKHIQQTIQRNGFLYIVHFQYVYNGYREKNLFVLPKDQ